MRIGFHASHEQWPPRELLRQAQRAEAAGFRGGMCSDHFHPWSEDQGQSGFSFSWLGAAMMRSSWSFGCVCAPGQRYHPALVAQAAATLAELFPGRFWLAIGSGEFLNEHITGQPWPEKNVRHARLKECAEVLRALWAGETVNHTGLVKVSAARLYTLPESRPQLLGAALTPDTAAWMAPWVDGLITAGARAEELGKTVSAFREHGGRGKPLYLQSAISFAATQDEARDHAFRIWRQAALAPQQLADVATPQEFDRLTRTVTHDAVEQSLRVSCEIEQHQEWLRQDAALGFDAVYLHVLNPDVDAVMDAFAASVLPEFHATDSDDRGQV